VLVGGGGALLSNAVELSAKFSWAQSRQTFGLSALFSTSVFPQQRQILAFMVATHQHPKKSSTELDQLRKLSSESVRHFFSGLWKADLR
jgi:hypothetical protein